MSMFSKAFDATIAVGRKASGNITAGRNVSITITCSEEEEKAIEIAKKKGNRSCHIAGNLSNSSINLGDNSVVVSHSTTVIKDNK